MEENKQETPVSQTPPTSGGQKMDEGKVMGILSYLSILCLIPYSLKKTMILSIFTPNRD